MVRKKLGGLMLAHRDAKKYFVGPSAEMILVPSLHLANVDASPERVYIHIFASQSILVFTM